MLRRGNATFEAKSTSCTICEAPGVHGHHHKPEKSAKHAHKLVVSSREKVRKGAGGGKQP
jgi:hypothetical protein